ncbi:hypothetical protein ACFVAV_18175 [Nocardia sp. NPDC057663]
MSMTVEFARHAGHGDILREQIGADGGVPAARSLRDRPNPQV